MNYANSWMRRRNDHNNINNIWDPWNIYIHQGLVKDIATLISGDRNYMFISISVLHGHSTRVWVWMASAWDDLGNLDQNGSPCNF